ncbi:MAG: DUF1203 domain-containing protein [Roseiarcus sp.]
MSFRIKGLSPEPFRPLFGLDEAELARRGVRRYRVDRCPGFPDRITMRDAEIGDTALLLNYLSHPVDSPYRTSYAIFVREGAEQVYDRVDEVPPAMRVRLLSLRGFGGDGFLLDADVVEGREVEPLIARLFANPRIAYIHAHNARHGCYSGLVERA